MTPDFIDKNSYLQKTWILMEKKNWREKGITGIIWENNGCWIRKGFSYTQIQTIYLYEYTCVWLYRHIHTCFYMHCNYLLNYKSKSLIRNSYFLSYHAKGYNFKVKYGHKFMCYQNPRLPCTLMHFEVLCISITLQVTEEAHLILY